MRIARLYHDVILITFRGMAAMYRYDYKKPSETWRDFPKNLFEILSFYWINLNTLRKSAANRQWHALYTKTKNNEFNFPWKPFKCIIDSRKVFYYVMIYQQKLLYNKRLTHAGVWDGYLGLWDGPPLVQEMACRLLGAMPLHERMLTYCWVYPWKLTFMDHKNSIGLGYNIISRKCGLARYNMTARYWMVKHSLWSLFWSSDRLDVYISLNFVCCLGSSNDQKPG